MRKKIRSLDKLIEDLKDARLDLVTMQSLYNEYKGGVIERVNKMSGELSLQLEKIVKMEQEVINHPDYLSVFSELTLKMRIKNYVRRIYITAYRLRNWIAKRSSNFIGFLRRQPDDDRNGKAI